MSLADIEKEVMKTANKLRKRFWLMTIICIFCLAMSYMSSGSLVPLVLIGVLIILAVFFETIHHTDMRNLTKIIRGFKNDINEPLAKIDQLRAACKKYKLKPFEAAIKIGWMYGKEEHAAICQLACTLAEEQRK